MRALRWVAATAIAAVVGVLMLFMSGVTIINMNNVHERTIAAPAARVGALLDTLASADDRFWPHLRECGQLVDCHQGTVSICPTGFATC